MAGRLGPLLLSALLATVMLAGCDRVDPERIRVCRSLVEALAPGARDLEVLPPEAARDAGYDVKIAYRAGHESGDEQPGWIALTTT